MQNRKHVDFDDRALYYISGAVYAQGKKGKDWHYAYFPVFGVYLMRFKEEVLGEAFRTDFRIAKMIFRRLLLTTLAARGHNHSASVQHVVQCFMVFQSQDRYSSYGRIRAEYGRHGQPQEYGDCPAETGMDDRV